MLLSTRHATPYPSSSSALSTMAKSRPPWLERSPCTFSRTMVRGRHSRTKRTNSKKRPDCFPRSPERGPIRASETSWHGNPAVQISDFRDSCFIEAPSCRHGRWNRRPSGAIQPHCADSGLQSRHLKHHRCTPPARSKPRSNPPIPAKNEASFMARLRSPGRYPPSSPHNGAVYLPRRKRCCPFGRV